MQISFYVEWDEDQKIGGCQGIFPINNSELEKPENSFKNILNSRIVSITLDDKRRLKFTVEAQNS